MDLTSFALGVVVGTIGAFFTGFLKKAGEDAWSWSKAKVFPAPPVPLAPMRVEGKFPATLYAPGDCAWVREEKTYEYEAKGYFYYPHPKNGARCFRNAPVGSEMHHEYLMVSPNATKTGDA
jgi:hypothetical protein